MSLTMAELEAGHVVPAALHEPTVAGLVRLDRDVRPGVLRDLADTFERAAIAALGTMDSALRAGNHDEVMAAAHSLKGAAGSVGAVHLAELLTALRARIAAEKGEARSMVSLQAIRTECVRVSRALLCLADANARTEH